MSSKTEKPKWYKLDNAGVLYTALQKERYSPVYRFSAIMTEAVDKDALQRAVYKTMPRFPSFCFRIRRGLFWQYFEPNSRPGPFVRPDISNPCQPVRYNEDNGWLVRFFYYEKRISLEAFHALSDGAGALVFFRTLLAVYLRETGHDIPNGDGVLDVTQPPQAEELEDAYAKHAGKKILRGRATRTAFANTSPSEPFYTLNVTMGFSSVSTLKEVSKRYNATITEYMAAVLLQSILENQAKRKPHRPREVALAIPINLRSWFETQTLRNFMLTVRVAIDPTLGEYSFQDLVNHVHNYLRLHINPQEMRATFTGNVRFTTNRALQLVPVFIKNPAMSFFYRRWGVKPYSSTFTNPGVFNVGDEMRAHIERMEVILGQATRPSPHCACMSYGDTMCITFAGTGISSSTERGFFQHLVRDGIPVKVESNRSY